MTAAIQSSNGKKRLLVTGLFLAVAVLHAQNTDEALQDPGKTLFLDRCAACHLQDGMGIREMNAPSIAGLPRWYVTDQLRKFRRDERGFHEEDSSGHLMQANAAALAERDIAFLGKHVESLEKNPGRNTLGDEPSGEGRKLYQKNCATCHGDNAEGDRSQRTPPLTSQPDWYLLRQMENFREGRRVHSENTIPEVDDEELGAIVAWISLTK